MNEPYLSPRRFKRWWVRMVSTVDHDEIIARVQQDGVISYHYAFLVVVAAGIATIGLLLNSPAVIIGAMLLSPLMGPIVLTGFSIAAIDVVQGRRGLAALLGGAAIALVVAGLIVFASPVREATPEILARTRPNLFDLIVAVLSGAAGGYATIRGRGGAVVGVAIATALMPPLAVVGYGLATAQAPLAKGAALLFLTNMVAIAVSAGLVAEWYGFGRSGFRRAFARQSLLALLALAPLAVPLYFSLKAIAWETFATQVLRQAVESSLAEMPDATLAEFQVRFRDEAPSVLAVVLTEHYDPKLEGRVRDRLRGALGSEDRVSLALDQVLVNEAKREAAGSGVAVPVLARPAAPPPSSLADTLRSSLPLPLAALEVHEPARRIVIVPAPGSGATLAGLRDMERNLAARQVGWQVTVVPPAMALPAIRFPPSSAELDDQGRRTVEDIRWALLAWRTERVEVAGHASSEGRGTIRLARERARVVAEALRTAGITAEASGVYPVAEQRAIEREHGMAALRVAKVRLPAGMPVGPEPQNPMVDLPLPATRGSP